MYALALFASLKVIIIHTQSLSLQATVFRINAYDFILVLSAK